VKVCAFLDAISQKVINLESIPRLQNNVVQCLVSFELVFPPSFFNIMTHLQVHLVEEITILDQYIPLCEVHGSLKKYVHNYARPEGNISKGYLTEKVIEFCVDFVPELNPIGFPQSWHDGRLSGKGTLGMKLTFCMYEIPPWWIRISSDTRILYTQTTRGSLTSGLHSFTWRLLAVGCKHFS
jgi:hypothetical protein